jgi:hypothetical protein
VIGPLQVGHEPLEGALLAGDPAVQGGQLWQAQALDGVDRRPDCAEDRSHHSAQHCPDRAGQGVQVGRGGIAPAGGVPGCHRPRELVVVGVGLGQHTRGGGFSGRHRNLERLARRRVDPGQERAQVDVFGRLLPGGEVQAEYLGGGQQGLVARDGGPLHQVGEVLAEPDHPGGLGGRAGAGVAQPVSQQVQQPDRGRGGHPHLRVELVGLAPGEVAGQHGT